MAKIGLFGGTFDPVHLGHLWVAQDAIEQADLERIIFIPAAQAPLRDDAPASTGRQRLRMLQAAVEGDPRFSVSTEELDRGGTSFTIDTVLNLRPKFPEDELFWLLGADQISRLSQWKSIEQLSAEVTFLGFERRGDAGAEYQIPEGVRLKMLSRRRCDISSSEIRERVQKQLPVHLFLSKNVYSIIKNESLYQGNLNLS